MRSFTATLTVLSILCLGTPALAVNSPGCDICKICDASLLVSLADNGFEGTVEGVRLLECKTGACDVRDVSGDLDLPLCGGEWDSAYLDPAPTSLFAYIELTYCPYSSGCYPTEMETVLQELLNCDL